MEKCLHCSGPLTHVPGRKKKSFCNTNCRNKYFYAKNKRLVEAAKGNMAAELNKSAILPKKAKDEPLVAPQTLKAAVDELPRDLPTKPKNLDELKELCPVELTGLDRSGWIRTERQKYGI